MNSIAMALVLIAFASVQLLIGGTRLLYCLPGCGFLAAAAIMTLYPKWRRSRDASVGCLVSAFLFFSYILGRSLSSPVIYLHAPIRSCAWALVVYLLVRFTGPERKSA